jgi:1,4-alpha-glucan branching enzyme
MLYRDYSRPEGEWVPNVFGGKENLEAVALLKRLNEVLRAECPGTITVAEESTAWPGVSRPTKEGGLGFSFKWNLGWMNDTLRYMKEDPIHRKWHHAALSFGLVYAFDEHFVLPISHDEVVHGKGSLLQRMPGDDWQRFANLRAYLGFMWGHPGKKLLFMGQEFAQPQEWNHEAALSWGLLEQPRHAGVQRLVQDLNRLYREQPALHRLDAEAAGFQWIEAHDDEQSVYAWMRHDGQGRPLIVVCNFTPVPRHGYRLGVFQNHPWREVLNTDADVYGGSNVGQMGALRHPEDVAAQGSRRSIVLSLPPLATIFLVPA